MNFSREEKEILLQAARDSISSLFVEKEIGEPDYLKHPNLKLKAGAFVTLKEFEELRGCIGYVISDLPLFKTVCNAARSAAVQDPRFYPLREDELNKIEIEISVLSPPFKMNNYDDIILGTHGLILEDLGRKGLLLPQVPVEHNMNKEEYLDAICNKAGLPENTWKSKQLNMKLFTASVFSEEEMREKNEHN
jgi:AmmeMemoRadiSam system protein A